MNVTINDARRMLVALLQRPDDGPVLGIDNFTAEEQDFMVTTCAATVMLHCICHRANGDSTIALAGLAALQLNDHIELICKNQ